MTCWTGSRARRSSCAPGPAGRGRRSTGSASGHGSAGPRTARYFSSMTRPSRATVRRSSTVMPCPSLRTRARSTARSSTAIGSTRPSSRTATRFRSGSTGLLFRRGGWMSYPPFWNRRRRQQRQRLVLIGRSCSPPARGVPGHLDLQDSEAPPRTRACSSPQRTPGGPPPILRARCRAARRDDPAPAARRVPAAARDPATSSPNLRPPSASAVSRSGWGSGST